MKLYKINNGGGVIRNLDGAAIPESLGNRDWQEYLAWKAAGGTPDQAFTQSEIDAKSKLDTARDATILRDRAVDELLDWAETSPLLPAVLKGTISAFKSKKQQSI